MFVDDPIAALRGTDLEKRTSVSMIILVWEALGFKLAYHKGQFAKVVTWIGGTLTCESSGVRARVKDAIVDDVKSDLKRITGQFPERSYTPSLVNLVTVLDCLSCFAPFSNRYGPHFTRT